MAPTYQSYQFEEWNNCTMFFYLIFNGKHHNETSQLEKEDGTIVAMVNSETNHFSMEETIIEDTPKGEHHFHTPFTGKEV
jgi:hypothetical protein